MEQGEINQDKLRNQLLFGFPVFFHDGKTRFRVQLYCDLQLTKIMWRHSAKTHQKENTISVSHIIGISLGANGGKFVHPKKGLHERRCFSIALEDKSWDLEAPSSKDRAKWVFTLRLLVGGLVKSWEEVEKEIKEEQEVIEDMEHRRSKVTSSLYQNIEPDDWEMMASPLSPRDMKIPAFSPQTETQVCIPAFKTTQGLFDPTKTINKCSFFLFLFVEASSTYAATTASKAQDVSN